MSTYAPLSCDRQTPQVRLCTLFPAAADEPLQCELRIHYLDQCDEFEALSYVWGDKDNRQPIVLNGQPFLVSKNLFAALKNLRNSSKPRTLWADALCINQDDDDERSAQVALMGQIYRRADTVISWLDTDSWMDLSEEMKSAQEFMRHVDFLRNHRPFLDYLDNKDTHAPDADFDRHVRCFDVGLWSFQMLLGERGAMPRYWKRAWITQEVVLARSWAMQVGSQTISIKDIEAISEFLGLPSVRVLMEERFQDRILRARLQRTSVAPFSLYRSLADSDSPVQQSSKHRYPKNSGPWPLLELLRYNRFRLCMNPRDKVYSVLGISDLADSKHPGLSIDYKTSIADVYTGAVQAIIESSSSLEVICSVTIDSSANALSLPSWVPNWNEEMTLDGGEQPVSYGNQSATKGTSADCEFSIDSSGNPLLTASGFCFGTVMDLKDRFIDTRARLTTGDFLRHIRRYYALSRQFSSAFVWATQALKPQKLSPETFRRTCAVGLLDHSTDDSFQELMEQLILCPLSADAEPFPADEVNSHGFGFRYRMMLPAIDGRCLFTVNPATADSSVFMGEGIIGMAPSGVIKRGDFVCLLLGCSAPLILRPLTDGRFAIVCPVYINCLMEGRAMDYLEQGLFTLERFIIK